LCLSELKRRKHVVNYDNSGCDKSALPTEFSRELIPPPEMQSDAQLYKIPDGSRTASMSVAAGRMLVSGPCPISE
jgi:hypothetical protein